MEDKNIWEKRKEETNRQYKYFLKYVKTYLTIKEFHTRILKGYQKDTKNHQKTTTPPRLNTLYTWSKTHNWNMRRKSYQEYILTKERREIEQIGRKKRINRLNYSDYRLGLSKTIMDEVMDDETLSSSSKAYALGQTSMSDRVSIDSDRLDTDQSTEIITNNIKNNNNMSVFLKIEKLKKLVEKDGD